MYSGYILPLGDKCAPLEGSIGNDVAPALAEMWLKKLEVPMSQPSKIAPNLYDKSAWVRALSDGNAKFASKLHAVIHEHVGTSANLIYSPFSISESLAMDSLGSKEMTLEQILHTCKFPRDPASLAEGYKEVLESLNGVESPKKLLELFIRKEIYHAAGYTLQEEFNKVLAQSFGSEVKAVDFCKGEGLESGNKNTRLRFLFWLSFKAQWKSTFDNGLTFSQEFHLEDGETEMVDMMNSGEQKFHVAIFKDLQAKAILIPYCDERFQMAIYLPDEGIKMSYLEKKLSESNLRFVDRVKGFFSGSCEKRTCLLLPAFKIKNTINLIPVLRKLGITDIFDPKKSDLSGMLKSSRNLYTSRYSHCPEIAVNEEGTTTYAATGKRFKCFSSLSVYPSEFRVNRPFLFQIIDLETKMILFAGSCMNPAE